MSNLVESLKDEYENLEELQKGAVVLMSTYMMRGMKTAMRYVVEAKRTQVTSTDIHICVRQELLRDLYWGDGNRERFVNEAETIRETLFGDDAEGGGASENGDDDDSDNEEDDEEEEEDDGEEEEWTPAISRKKWVQDIHRAQTEWDEWKPTDPTERLLKKTVEDVYNKLRN